MLGKVRQHHHRNIRQEGVGLNGFDDLKPVAVIPIELSIDQYQVDVFRTQALERVFRPVGLKDARIKVVLHQGRDGGVIRQAIPNIQDGFAQVYSG